MQTELTMACTDLFIAYARHIDFGEYDRFVDLFAEDAVLDLGFRLEGKAAIAKSMNKRDPLLRSRHVLTNIHISPIDDKHADGIAYLSLYRHIGPETAEQAPITFKSPSAIGHYSNQFTLTSNGWKISSCQLSFAFINPEHFG